MQETGNQFVSKRPRCWRQSVIVKHYRDMSETQSTMNSKYGDAGGGGLDTLTCPATPHGLFRDGSDAALRVPPRKSNGGRVTAMLGSS